MIAVVAHRSNKEDLADMWKSDGLPLAQAAVPRDRFKLMLVFIRFDKESTRAERAHTDKAAPIRDVWTMLNRNVKSAYKLYGCITVDKQLTQTKLYEMF